MPTKLTPDIITAAIRGFEEQKRQIDTKLAELRAMSSGTPSAAPPAPRRKRRRMSAAASRPHGGSPAQKMGCGEEGAGSLK
jgi:hypothetical protein